jgi:hypothetical protein
VSRAERHWRIASHLVGGGDVEEGGQSALMSAHHVEEAGENVAALASPKRPAMVLIGRMGFCGAVGMVGLITSGYKSRVVGNRWPLSTVWSLELRPEW